MGLSKPFGLVDTRAEFGPTNRPNGLRGMYVRIFGSVTAGVSALSDFEGYGKPQVTDTTSDPQTGTSLEITFNLTRNSLDANVRVEYSTNLDMSGSTFTSPQTYTSDGSKTISIPLAAGTYYYRIESWNLFNDQHVNDRDLTQVQSVVLSQPTLATPSLLSTITYDGVDNDYLLKWNTSGDEPTGYEFNYRLNGGAWNSPVSVTDKVNWNTSPANTKEAQVEVSSLPDPGDNYEFRVRATRSGYTTSAWSNIESFTH